MPFVNISETEAPPSDRMLIDALCIVLGSQLFARSEYTPLHSGIPNGDLILQRAEDIVQKYGRIALERIAEEQRGLAGGDGSEETNG